MNNFVKRQKSPTCLLSEITGGTSFAQKYTFFAIFGHYMGSGRSGNLKNGLAMPQNPYFDPSHISELPLGGETGALILSKNTARFWDFGILVPELVIFFD